MCQEAVTPDLLSALLHTGINRLSERLLRGFGGLNHLKEVSL